LRRRSILIQSSSPAIIFRVDELNHQQHWEDEVENVVVGEPRLIRRETAQKLHEEGDQAVDPEQSFMMMR